MSSSLSADIGSLIMPGLVALLVIWITNRFGKLSVSAKKWWLFAHVLGVMIYMGGALGTLMLTVLTRTAGDVALIHGAAHFVSTFDHFLIIPGAVISLVTGLVLAIRTSWGLANYYWVICKWIGNIGLIMFGATVQRHMMENLASAATGEAAMLQSTAFLNSRSLMLLTVGIVLATMIFLSAISYVKPWGKRAV